MSLSGKVVLITGSSKGIGKAAALRVASEGASVVINYLRDPAAANNLVEQIGTDRALAVQADASKMADLDRLVDAAVARFGKIDVLIPNAGILPVRDLENTTEEDFDRTYNLMVKGPYFLAQVRTHESPSQYRPKLIPCTESREAYALRRTNHLCLHLNCSALKRGTRIPTLYILQRRNRANDSHNG